MSREYDGFYQWLYPKAGGFSVFRKVEDYEAEKAAGFSIYPDCRDLEVPGPVVAEAPKVSFPCDVCGKVLPTKLALAGHKRSHK